MTTREFYAAIASVDTLTATQIEELKADALARIEKLDAANVQKNAKAAEKRAKENAVKAPIVQAILAQLSTTEAKTATTLIEEAGELKDANGVVAKVVPQSITSMFKPYIENGIVVKEDVKVQGKGTQRGYRLASEDALSIEG